MNKKAHTFGDIAHFLISTVIGQIFVTAVFHSCYYCKDSRKAGHLDVSSYTLKGLGSLGTRLILYHGTYQLPYTYCVL